MAQPLIDFSPIYAAIGLLPLDCLAPRFMQQALLGLLLLTPMTAFLGIDVVNFRMSFFSDAVSHSAFTGVALGLIFTMNPKFSIPAFGLFVGFAIMFVFRKSNLSADTAIGVIFSAVVAFGLAVISRASGMARDMQRFLYGDILTIGEGELTVLALLLLCMILFHALACNRLLLIVVSPVMAKAHGVNTAFWQYAFAALLALVVSLSVWAVGVFLVTALLIVPAAAARNLAASTSGAFWWALFIGVTSGFLGLVLSAQEWCSIASGAGVILVACAWFAVSAILAPRLGREKNGRF